MNYKRLIIFISALTFVTAQLVFLRWYDYMALIFLIWLIILSLSIWFVIVDKIFSAPYLYYLSVPLFFSFSIFGMNSILEIFWQQLSLIIGGGFFLWLYLTQLALYNFDFSKYVSPAIENVSGYLNLISLFFLSIFGSALVILIGVPLWMVSLGLMAITAIIIHQSTWVAHINPKKRIIYLFGLTIILTEIFWSLSLLPTNFFLQGLLYTVTFYFCWNVSKSSLLGILHRNLLMKYLAIATLSVLLAALTAQWI